MASIRYDIPIQPRQVRLELTTHCSARCIFCHRTTNMTRSQGDMTMALVEKCLHDIRQFPNLLTEIVPAGWGEIWCYIQWRQALELIASQLPQTSIVIPTNGILLTDGIVTNLTTIKTLRVVNVSVNAFLPETWEAIHGVKNHLPQIEASVALLHKLRPDILLWVSMVRDPLLQSEKEVDLFKEHWSQYGQVQINMANYAGVKGKEPIIHTKLPCRSIYTDMQVLWDGRVVTGCCWDADGLFLVGDATSQTLMECWHSKEYNRIRRLHNEGRRHEVQLCGNCTFS